MADITYEIWLVAYATGDQPVSVDTVLKLFDETECAFDMPLKSLTAGKSGMSNIRVADGVRNWVSRWFDVRYPQDSIGGDPELGGSVTIGAGPGTRNSWFFASHWGPRHHQRVGSSPCSELLINIDIDRARNPSSTYKFLCNVSQHLLADSRIWYAHIDVASSDNVSNRATYFAGTWPVFARWEQLAEHAYWQHFALGTRDRVRGVYWGNILGTDFASRLKEAGYDEITKWMQSELGPEYEPVTLKDVRTGSIAILLDEDPVAFAKTRDTGYMNMGSMNRSVKSAAIVRDAFSRARLL